MKRRDFLETLAAAGTLAVAAPRGLGQERPGEAGGAAGAEPPFRISLAGWSLHRRHFVEGKLPAQTFPRVAREEFDIGAIELVNTMLPSPTYRFLTQLRRQGEEHDVRILLIMVDAEGDLSSADRDERLQAVRNHRKWIDACAVLGGHCIRVNTGGAPGDERAIRDCADSLRRLAAYGMEQGIEVVCENHGGMSSHPESMARLMRAAGSSHVGTLPDFGNFPPGTDRYAAVAAMMPWAKAVSAKCYDFGEDGEESGLDFRRMMDGVLAAGYRGHVGIEFEGQKLSEHDGILAARELLRTIAAERAAARTP